MKSNVCKIEKGVKDLGAILKESEKVALFNGLTEKQTLQLRLLCEEMDGMLPNIIDDFDGEFWIEYEAGVCKLNADIEFAEFTQEKKQELISVAKDKKNAAAVGLVGKIRCAIEEFFLSNEKSPSYDVTSGLYAMSMSNGASADYYCLWGLTQYKETVNQAEKTAEWDELEKSIIASLADDVIVGVKGKKAKIVIIKKFA